MPDAPGSHSRTSVPTTLGERPRPRNGEPIDRGQHDAAQHGGAEQHGLSNNGGDVAEPAGSRSGRRAESAPLRNDPAGALIARINNGAPVLVGNRRTFTAPDSGRLYLSVNDDFFPDNVGEYRATVSVSR